MVFERAREPRLQQGPLLWRRPGALCRPHGLQRGVSCRAVDGDQGREQQGRLGVDVHDPQGLALVRQRAGPARVLADRERPHRAVLDSRWSDNAPVSARDFEYSWKRQLNPESKAPYAAFLYDIKNGEAFNKKQITDASQVGVRAKDDWTLEVTLERPRGYFPVLAAYLAAHPGYQRAIEKFGVKWTEPGNIVCNGPFVLDTWEH